MDARTALNTRVMEEKTKQPAPVPDVIDERMRCPICREIYFPEHMRWQLNGRAVCPTCSEKIADGTLGLRL